MRQVRQPQNNAHQQGGHEKFREERSRRSVRAGHGNGVLDRWIGKGAAKEKGRDRDSQHPAQESEYYIKDGVQLGDFAKTKIRKRNGWIEVRAGALSRRGMNDQNRGDAHGDAHKRSPHNRAGQQVKRRISGVKEEDRKLSLIHISEPTRQAEISYAVFCLKK